MSGPGYDPRGSGRARRAGQVLQALTGLNLSGEGGSINVAALASGTINYVLTSSANTVVIIFDTPGATSWISPITGNCLVECWGPGGNATTHGAGGGEERSDTIAVVANTAYPIFIGDPTLGFTSTSFNSTSVVAIGGANATSSGPGAGGTGGTGATGFAGGAGGAGGAAPGDDLGGGGGGSSAGTAAIGVNGAGRSGAAGGAGGTAPSGGGTGGNGGTSANGQNGQVPGGGGGGKSSRSTTAGVGAKGKIRLTYTDAGTVTAWKLLTAVNGNTITTGTGTLTLSTFTITATGNATVSGTNTGDQTAASLGLYVAATANLLAQTGGVATVLAVTSPNDSANHQYVVGGYVNITAVTLDVVVLQVRYTDENSVTQTVSFYPMGLTSANLAATGVYSFPNTLIRVAPNTSITLKATLTTGTGSITYDVGGLIQRID